MMPCWFLLGHLCLPLIVLACCVCVCVLMHVCLKTCSRVHTLSSVNLLSFLLFLFLFFLFFFYFSFLPLLQGGCPYCSSVCGLLTRTRSYQGTCAVLLLPRPVCTVHRFPFFPCLFVSTYSCTYPIPFYPHNTVGLVCWPVQSCGLVILLS